MKIESKNETNSNDQTEVKSCMGILCGFYGETMRIYFDFKGSTEIAKRAKERKKMDEDYHIQRN